MRSPMNQKYSTELHSILTVGVGPMVKAWVDRSSPMRVKGEPGGQGDVMGLPPVLRLTTYQPAFLMSLPYLRLAPLLSSELGI